MNDSWYISIGFSWFRFFVIFVIGVFLLRVSTNTCSLTLNFRFWVCPSSAKIKSHRTIRYFQELDAPYRTWTFLLMLDFSHVRLRNAACLCAQIIWKPVLILMANSHAKVLKFWCRTVTLSELSKPEATSEINITQGNNTFISGNYCEYISACLSQLFSSYWTSPQIIS